MQTCSTCHTPLSSAPWRYDDTDRTLHWICPGGEEAAGVYAPMPLRAAIFEFLSDPIRDRRNRQPHHHQTVIRRAS